MAIRFKNRQPKMMICVGLYWTGKGVPEARFWGLTPPNWASNMDNTRFQNSQPGHTWIVNWFANVISQILLLYVSSNISYSQSAASCDPCFLPVIHISFLHRFSLLNVPSDPTASTVIKALCTHQHELFSLWDLQWSCDTTGNAYDTFHDVKST